MGWGGLKGSNLKNYELTQVDRERERYRERKTERDKSLFVCIYVCMCRPRESSFLAEEAKLNREQNNFKNKKRTNKTATTKPKGEGEGD